MNATDKQLKNNIDEFKGDEAKLDPLALKSFANSKKSLHTRFVIQY